MVICTCSYCRTKQVIINGVSQPGCSVSASTRLDHEKKAAKVFQAAVKPQSQSPVKPSHSIEKATGLLQISELQCTGIDPYTELTLDTSSIVNLCCTLVIWLNLKVGVSREAANIILKAIHFILSTIFNLLQVALALNGIHIKLPEIQIPHDLRTAYCIHSSDPDIIRTSCCPKCYTIYTGTIPLHCSWRESPRARVCNSELWRLQQFGKNPRSVPKTLYNTQNFESWLHFFLSRRSVEDHLESAFLRTPAAFGQEMHDLQDSPAWKDLQDFLSHRYHLVFGLYIDWFNPYTNKIAGMSNA